MAVSDIQGSLRFDSKYHLSRHNPLIRDMAASGLEMIRVSDRFLKENVWIGNIFSRIYASDVAAGKPLLVPYDIFRYIPWSDKILSRSQVDQFDRLQIKRGMLMVACSGRNLGPATIADSFCERFVMSHDMIRIEDGLSDELFYLAAFLKTSYGQAAVRTDMNGSVIDHIDAKQMRELRYPLVPEPTKRLISRRFRLGFLRREAAREKLERVKHLFLEHFQIENFEASFASSSYLRRFTVNRKRLCGRIDAEANAPQYQEYRTKLLELGGRPLNSIARVFRPSNRYKTNYVEEAAFGMPMMNGRQISQYQTIALKLMNVSGIKGSEVFELTRGMTLLTADGRAEENLADCVMVHDDRAGWGASGHVHRVQPFEGVNPGLVYLACSSPPVQAQLKAIATGSVVDALSEEDVGNVIVPYDDGPRAIFLGDEAQAAWRAFSKASASESIAVAAFEDAIRQGSLKRHAPVPLRGFSLND